MFSHVKDGLVYKVSTIDLGLKSYGVECEMPKCDFGFLFRDVGNGKQEAEAKLNAHAGKEHHV